MLKSCFNGLRPSSSTDKNHNNNNNNNNRTTSKTSATESSPLLDNVAPSRKESGGLKETSQQTDCSILVDIIGARWLPIENRDCFCVVQYGSKHIHQTTPFAPKLSRVSRISRALRVHQLFGSTTQDRLLQRSLQNPIWTIKEHSLCSFRVTLKDLANNKPLTISIYAKPRPIKLRQQAADINCLIGEQRKVIFVGKVRMTSPEILKNTTQERLDFPLLDDLGRGIASSSWEDVPMLAVRFRVASAADIAFAEQWNYLPRPFKLLRLVRIAQLKMDWNPSATLVTELPEIQVHGASISTAVRSSILPASTEPGKILVKPYADPTRKSQTDCLFPKELKRTTRLPSTKWIHAGSKATSLGRMYLEILSCHDLPNVDIGGSLGNQTDAFCAVIYGDAMVQTDMINDELSPHWMPWTQRAFCMEMQHPSQVLYIGVFGFKRRPLRHKPIGRIEINPNNFQYNNTRYNLEYEIFQTSHERIRRPRGRIRLRIRMEVDNERKKLLAALQPPPAVHINVRQKKSLRVARYTACGEYDNEETFNLKVLQSYIDEVIEGFLRRLFYAIQDGFWSLVLWRDQMQLFDGFSFPVYSMLSFFLGMLAVEFPQWIPAIFCFSLALLLLVQMQQRINSPSPWRRCSSFSHYLRILIIGKSPMPDTSIKANEGWEEQCKLERELEERIAQDKDFFEKKDAIEKEIEGIENEGEATKSKTIPLELLVVLGKVQGIVGDVCRFLRAIDAVITWEESHISFFLTSGLLMLGIVFLFIPWGFVLTWLGRITVVLLLGPQNKLIDILLYQNQTETIEQRIRRVFMYRLFEARCHHEEVGKRRAFRSLLFGKYSTYVPSILWSPHRDFPLSVSTSHAGFPKLRIPTRLLAVEGQLLKGKMIPRPPDAWEINEGESKMIKSEIELGLVNQSSSKDQEPLVANESHLKSQASSEGFEVTDLYDEEAAYVRGICKPMKEESSRELGVQVLDDSEGSARYLPVWKSISSFRKLPEVYESDEGNQSGITSGDSLLQEPRAPFRLSAKEQEALSGQSVMELGVEVSEDVHDVFVSEYDSDDTTEASSEEEGERRDLYADDSNLGSSVKEGGTFVSEKFQDDSRPQIRENNAKIGPDDAMQPAAGPIKIPELDRQALYGQSTIELGIEIAEDTSTLLNDLEKGIERQHTKDEMLDGKEKNAPPASQPPPPPIRFVENETRTFSGRSTIERGVEIIEGVNDEDKPTAKERLPVVSQPPRPPPPPMRFVENETRTFSGRSTIERGVEIIEGVNDEDKPTAKERLPVVSQPPPPPPPPMRFVENETRTFSGRSTIERGVEIIEGFNDEDIPTEEEPLPVVLMQESVGTREDKGDVVVPIVESKPFKTAEKELLTTKKNRSAASSDTGADDRSQVRDVRKGGMSGDAARLRWMANREENWEGQSIKASDKLATLGEPKANVTGATIDSATHERGTTVTVAELDKRKDTKNTDQSSLDAATTEQKATMVRDASQDLGYEVLDV